MNIREFKEGDIITRNEPVKYERNGSSDSSYCGDRLIFVGFDEDSKIIFLERESGILSGTIDLSFARDKWDEGWAKYPKSLYEKTKDYLKSIKKDD